MKLTQDERISIEDAIFDAHFSAQKYLETGKDLHEKLLEVSVKDALELLQEFSEKLKGDSKAEVYKLHIFVPVHLYKMVELRNESNEEEDEKS